MEKIDHRIIMKYILPVAIGVLFTLIGLVMVRNEVFFDDWYIESAADGLFGENNRSLLTIGSNYVILAIIWLLSLTGIRLSWLHVMMVGMNMISSIMICRVICDNVNGKWRYIFSCIVLTILTPLMNFYLQFTTTAAYVVATGCLWIFYALTMEKRMLNLLIGGTWVVLGSCLRFDAIYFSLVFMGSIALVKVGEIIRRNTDNKSLIFRKIIQFLAPFLVVLVCASCLEISQRVLLNKYYPGFREWNTVRAHVDDYELPEYSENEAVYKEIGLSYNDYNLLKSWNNLDESYFTEDLYNEVLSIRNDSEKGETKGGFLEGVVYIIKVVQSNYCFIFILVGVVIAFGIYDGYCMLGAVFVLIDTIILSAYFIITERFIWRTEWPIYMVSIISLIAMMLCLGKRKEKKLVKDNVLVNFVICACLLGVLFISPILSERNVWCMYNGKSIVSVYKERMESEDTYGKYVWNKLNQKPVAIMATIDRELNEYTKQNKHLLFYHLFQRSWLQPNPLTNKDLFRAEDIGAGENWGALGQYICRLAPMKNVSNSYGVEDTFKDLTHRNVRVVIQNHELCDRTKELNVYLKEHYYSNVDFSMTGVLSHVGMGRFISDVDEDGLKTSKVKIKLGKPSETHYKGMIRIDIDCTLNEEDLVNDSVIQFASEDGEVHNFHIIKWAGEKYIIIFDDVLSESKDYSVKIINANSIYEKKGLYNIKGKK